MLGRTNIKTDYRNIFGNEKRIKIWELCKKNPRSFTEIKKILKIPSGTLHHHLNLMKKAKLLKIEEVKEGDKFKRGKETKISANMERFNEMFKKEQEEAKKYFHSQFPDELKLKLLKLLKENQPISRFDFNKLLIENGHPLEVETFLITHLIYDRKIEEIYQLTKEGEQFVKENDLKTTKLKEKEENKSGNTTQKEPTATEENKK